MSETIGDLKVKLGIDSSGFTSGIQQAQQAAGGLGSMLQQAIGTATGFVVAEGVMKAVGAATDFAKSSMLGYNSTLEQASIGFTTMLGSAQQAQAFLSQLKDFANTSPFELPDVLVGSQRLLAMGFAAGEVIPLLTDVGNVSAAMGKGKAGIDALTLALGQMNASVILHTQDLNQMIQVGVPVWDILAQATGKNTAEVRSLVENGQIASDVFTKAFDQWARANYGDMMAAQSKTGAGALSTITDVLHSAVAQGTEPLYQGLARVANLAATFLQSTAFQAWVAQVAQLSAIAVQALGGLARSLAGLLGINVDALEAQAGLSGVGDAGTKAGEDTSAALSGVQQSLTGVGAAADNAGSALKAQAADADAHLRDLTKSSDALADQEKALQYQVEDTGKAFDDQAQALSDRQESLQRSIEDTSAAFDKQIAAVKDSETGLQDQIDATTKAFDSQISTVKDAESGLQRSIEDVTAAWDAQINAVRNQESDLQSEIDSVTNAYEGQIQPLQDQIDLLTKAKDLEQQRKDDALKLKDIQLQEAAIAAEGDPTVRAKLTTQLQLLQYQQQQHDNATRIASLQQQIANAGPNTDVAGLQIQLQQVQTQQQLLNLADNNRLAQIAGAQELVKGQEQVNSLTEQEQATKNDIAAIPLEEKVAALTAAEKAQLEPLKAQLTNLQAQEQSLNRQKTEQLAPMQDQLKSLQRQEQDLSAQRTQALAPMQAQLSNLQDQEKSLERQKTQQLAPMQEQVKDLQRQEQDLSRLKRDTLAPMQDQLTNLQRQNDQLESQKKHWQEVKSDIEAAQQAASGAAGPSITVAPGTPRLPTQQPAPWSGEIGAGPGGGGTPPAVDIPIVDKIRDIIKAIGDFSTTVIDDWLPALNRFWNSPDAAPITGFLQDVRQGIDDSIASLKRFADTTSNQPQPDFGPTPGDATGTAAKSKSSLQQIADGFADADTKVRKLTDDYNNWLATLNTSDSTWNKFKTKMGESADAWSNLGTTLGNALVGFRNWARSFSDTNESTLDQAVKKYGESWDSISTTTGRFIGWLTGPAFTNLTQGLAGWGQAFIDWVAPIAAPLLGELGKLLGSALDWIGGTALGDLAKNLGKWGSAFVDWVGPVPTDLLLALGKLLLQIGTWVEQTAVPWAGQEMAKLGDAIVHGIMDGVSKAGDWFKTQWNQWIDSHIPDPFKGALEIHSPSRVMAELGKQIPAGLLVGINAGAPDLAARMGSLVPLPSLPTTPSLPNGSAFPGNAGGGGSSVTLNFPTGSFHFTANSPEEIAKAAASEVEKLVLTGLRSTPQASTRLPGVPA